MLGTKERWFNPACSNAECGCEWTDSYATEAEAIAAWNTRAELGNGNADTDDALALLDEIRETGRISYDDYSQLFDAIAVLGGGTLTAEQVREVVCRNSTYNDIYKVYQVSHADMQAIADELNARAERTCSMEYQTEGMQRGWWKCSECGEAMDTIKACGGRKQPRWCGNCGRKVVDNDE